MTSKNCMWALLAFSGSLLAVAAPTVTQAAEQGSKVEGQTGHGHLPLRRLARLARKTTRVRDVGPVGC